MKKLSLPLLGIGIASVTIFSIPQAHAAISATPVQQATSSAASGSTLSTTFVSTPAAGDFLELFYGNTAQSPTVTSIVGGGVTWVNATQANGNGVADAEIWYGLNASGSGTKTVTTTLSGTTGATARITMAEWSGVATTNALDVSGTSTSPTSGNVTTSVITPTAGLNELIIAGFKGPSITTGPTQGFTDMASSTGSNRSAYLVVPSTAGSYFTSWNGGSAQYNTGIAAFKAAASGAASAPVPKNMILTMNW